MLDRLRENPRDGDALFASAAFLAAQEKTREAVERLNELAKVDPAYPGLWRFKARLYQDLGNLRLASLCASRNGEWGATVASFSRQAPASRGRPVTARIAAWAKRASGSRGSLRSLRRHSRASSATVLGGILTVEPWLALSAEGSILPTQLSAMIPKARRP